MERARTHAKPPAADPRRNTRLVYSTGGEVESEPAAPDAAVAASSGPKASVRLRLDRRASGRVVTLVTGLPGSAADLARLARDLRSACGTGGTFKDGAVELQGDRRDKLEALLRARGIAFKRA